MPFGIVFGLNLQGRLQPPPSPLPSAVYLSRKEVCAQAERGRGLFSSEGFSLSSLLCASQRQPHRFPDT